MVGRGRGAMVNCDAGAKPSERALHDLLVCKVIELCVIEIVTLEIGSD